MIVKLNFVPKEEKERFVIRVSWTKVYLLCLALAVILVLASFGWLHRELYILRSERDYLQKEKKRYEVIIKRVEELKKQDEEIRNRIETIISLKEKRGFSLKILDNVVLAVPMGKMYLTNFEMGRSSVRIKGFSIDYENVAAFLRNLERRSGLFKEVALEYTQQKEVKGYNLVEFRVSVRY